MSGDVQPRKRKDKRKKRDERKSDGDVSVLRQPSFQDDEDSSSHGVHITKMGNDDVHLHVQQQHGTGGHWCAKIIFFSLMAVLLGLVGLIIMENRGLEDLDTPLSESRYSNYFDGWVEEHRQEEHDAHHSPEAALDEHDDEHDEEPDEAYDEHSGEEEEDHEADEEEEEAEEDENTGAENLTAEDDDDEDDDREEEPEASVEPTQSVADDADENDEEEEDADDEVEESIEPPVSRSRAQSAPETVEEDDDDDIEEEEEEEDADEEELEESIEPTISQSQAQSAPEKADDDNDDDDDEYAAEEDEEPQESIEPAQQSAPDVDDDDDDEDFEQDENDEDEFESLDQEVDNEAEERQRQAAAEARAKHAKQDPGPEDNAETITTASWLGSQIKPKQPTGAQSAEDDLFEQQLRQANAEMINENYAKALRDFNTLTHTHAHKPAAHLHRARALERLAKLRQSNQLLLDAIESYKRYLAFEELIASDGVDDSDYRAAGVRCIQHLRFLGRTQQAVGIHEQLLARYPDEAQLRNELSLTHLMSNNLVKLQQVAAETLERWPHDPQAQLHFGLALKQLGADYAGALPYLQRAIDSGAAGTQEPYFYLALGETLQRLGRQTQALQLYRRGADRGFFASVYQRSLYNVPGLRAQPFWQPAETGQAAQLEQLQRNWRAIRAEALALLGGEGNFQLEAEQLRDTGNWQQFELYARGKRLERNCQRAPVTCALLDRFPAASSCRRGQIKFSAMQAQTHVWPHCGPTNCRLRAHLTLVAPEPQLTSLRVAEHQRTWQEGDLFIFDDSFEHEVWHNGTQLRLVLIVDLWHPDLSAAQRRSLTAI